MSSTATCMSPHAESHQEPPSPDLAIQSYKERRDFLENRPGVAQTSTDAFAYPVLSLPPEITSTIFLHCLSSNPDGRPQFSRAPLVFLLVCRRWKDIALATHGLWRHLSLSTVHIGQAQKFATAWFQRAGTLSVSLNFTGWDSNAPYSIISLSAPRLQSLTLNLPLKDFPMDEVVFPMLERLTLGVLLERDQSVQRHLFMNQPYRCFNAAPRLREICLQRPAIPALFAFPSGRLTKFTGEDLTANQCLAFLRSATALIECNISVELNERPTDDRRVVLSHLRSLHLRRAMSSNRITPDSVPELLRLLDAPALERLKLVRIPDLGFAQASMIAFFTGVSASLRYFSYVGDDHECLLFPAAIFWFDELPNLTHIEFVRPTRPFTVLFMANLLVRTVLPHLHTLRLLDYQFPFDKSLVCGLDFRSWERDAGELPALVEVFDLVWDHPMHPTYSKGLRHKRLQRLVKRGMRIHIGSRDGLKYF